MGALAGSVEQDLGMIVESAAEGDEIAFGRIVAAYQDQMYCLCVAVCHDRSLAEEAAQSAWSRIWQRIGTLREADKLRPWVMSVAVNEAKSALRRRRRSLSAVEVLESLSEPVGGFMRLGDTRDEVAEAEIVVVYGNPRDSGASDAMETCVSTSPIPRDPPPTATGEGLQPYREILESIYERVFALAGDRPVIVRAIDLYNPVIADWRLAGIEAECTAAWETWSDTMRAAAAEFGVPLVSMYDALNGPDHSADPRLEGYIASDGEHLLPPGREVAAAAMHEAGYEPVAP